MTVQHQHESDHRSNTDDYLFEQIDNTGSVSLLDTTLSLSQPLLFRSLTRAIEDSPQGHAKRYLDIFVALVLLLIASPLMLSVAALIWLSTLGRDPVFYRQLRVGYEGLEFYVLKFRSMRTDAEKEGARMAAKNDDRVTRIGRFIRKTRIDELPQLLNVLRGDMSLVGPRPERPEFVSKFEDEIEGYAYRHQVKPGITGLAQVSYPYGDSVEDAANKLFYDLTYVRKNSVGFDLKILLKTIPVVLTGHGAR
ncbi:MAG: exopolysaccharide biosynthesis polyprenyl glycosylphosphotransferase [Candidatus Thiodiazotropha sp.]|jgi:exopolysaccharide biosynthesis polyprenyl glycosylphosphotransferase